MSTHLIRNRFGDRIRKQRGSLRITQEELAGRAGLHRTYVADIERGSRNPSLESIDKLARALGVPLAMLFHPSPPTDQEDPASVVSETDLRMNLLLVEDNPNDVALTLRAFERSRLANRVDVVRDGAEALDFLFCQGPYEGRVFTTLPGVILLDLNLPKVEGVEVLRRIKAEPRTATIPVVILTASVRERDALACRQLGADAYLVKPVNFQAFCDLAPKLSFSWILTKGTRPREATTLQSP